MTRWSFTLPHLCPFSLNLNLQSAWIRTHVAFLITAVAFTCAHWSHHPRYGTQNHQYHHRWKRQGFGNLDPSQTVELNFSVPFIFSARTYAYGEAKGDSMLGEGEKGTRVTLKHPLGYFNQQFDSVYISRDGALLFSQGYAEPSTELFPRGPKVIAPFWTKVSLGQTGRVYYRETQDDNVLSLASNEVQIQYGHAPSFRPSSVLIVTWENVAPPDAPENLPINERNMFQVALILSTNGSFAHMVYSKMRWSNNALAGFNEGNGYGSFGLPGSGSPQVMLLANESDIGIPGEWMFKIDGANIALCGPGFKGLECINRCTAGEWYYDCRNRCHCANRATCSPINGHCPAGNPICEEGWSNAPACEIDVDECELSQEPCDISTPDCINTPGSFICTCLTGFDNDTQTCRGHTNFIAGENNRIDTFAHQPELVRVTRPPGSENGIIIVPQLSPGNRLPPLSSLNRSTTGFIEPSTPSPTPPPQLPTSPVAGPTQVLTTVLDPQQDQSEDNESIPPNADQSSETEEGSSISISTPAKLQSTAIPAVIEPGKPGSTLVILPNGTRVEPKPASTVLVSQEERVVDEPVTVELVERGEGTVDHEGEEEDQGQTAKPTVILPQFTITAAEAGCDLSCGEHGHCELVQRQPICVCDRGWSGDGIFCADINECFLENACVGNARCQNTDGGYNCLCQEGFAAEGEQCVDIDECATGLVKCPGGNTSHCVNTHGGYECRCKTGYNGNPTSILGCIDINECLIPEFYCGPNAQCENTLGAYRCHCNEGFVHSSELSECVDIDECLQSPCAKAAVCRNTPGTFECDCLEGFSGDGFRCAETILYPFSRIVDERLPQQKNAMMEVDLTFPVNYLGVTYPKIFVSANGLITFDRPQQFFANLDLDSLGLMGLAPLYQSVDLTKGGGVFIKQTTDQSLLTRASLNIQEDFNEPSFSAESVTVITYENVLPDQDSSELENEQTEDRNTYQAIITSGSSGTYVTYIYDQLNSRRATAGLISTKPDGSVSLPGSGENVLPLAETSNVGLVGKWIFRVDLSQLISCPAGYTGPPYCLTDINECSVGLARCHQRAICTNYAGSYGCACPEGWSGDGVTCYEMDVCSLGGLICDGNANCIVQSNGEPACRCTEGFQGNGISCVTAVSTSELLPETSTLPPQSITTPKGSTQYTPSIAPTTTRSTSVVIPFLVTSSGNVVTGSFNQASHGQPASTSTPVESLLPSTTPITPKVDSRTIASTQKATTSSSSSSSTATLTQQLSTESLATLSKGSQSVSEGSVAEVKTSSAETSTAIALIPSTTPPRPIIPGLPTKPTTPRQPLIPGLPTKPPPFLKTPDQPRWNVPTEIERNYVAESEPEPSPERGAGNYHYTHESDPNELASEPEYPGNAINNNRVAGAREGDKTTKRPLIEKSASSSSSLLVIIIPAVLCGVWLILILVLMVCCVRRRKQRQRAKYGLGYYMAPSQVGGATAKASGSAGAPGPGVGANGANYAAYGSQWSIPRVNQQSTDYNNYQASYYSTDPYAPYKY